jgi:hypothetical protein
MDNQEKWNIGHNKCWTNTITIYDIIKFLLAMQIRACGSNQDFLDGGLLPMRKLLKSRVPSCYLNSTVATMTWLTVPACLYHKWPRIFSVYRSHNIVLRFPFITYHPILTRVVRRVSLVEKELFTLSEHLSKAPVLWGLCFSIFSFVRSVLWTIVCGISVSKITIDMFHWS